jgi:hypothetical protein
MIPAFIIHGPLSKWFQHSSTKYYMSTGVQIQINSENALLPIRKPMIAANPLLVVFCCFTIIVPLATKAEGTKDEGSDALSQPPVFGLGPFFAGSKLLLGNRFQPLLKLP